MASATLSNSGLTGEPTSTLDMCQSPDYYCVLGRSSYPERNFEWNQLLDSSIGLSPLCSIDTIDLHVKTATDFHPSFLGLRLHQA